MPIERQRYQNNTGPITKLVIGSEVTKENPKSTYRFEVHTYFGDADAYETLQLFLEDKAQAIQFANFLKTQMAVAYPHGRGGGDEYRYKYSPDVPDWKHWFGDGYEVDEETGKYVHTHDPIFPESWPCNWDYWGEASYDYTHIFYFDEDGREYSVEAM